MRCGSARKASSPRRASSGVAPASRAGEQRRQRVRLVVRAGQRGQLRGVALLVAARQRAAPATSPSSQPPSVSASLRSRRRTRLRGDALRDPHRQRVVGVDHREVVAPLRVEDPRLGRGVALEPVVAIEVIGGDVEQHRHARAKRLDRLELEARRLDHADAAGAGRRRADRLGERLAQVAADERRPAGLGQDRARTAWWSSTCRWCR